MANSLCKRSNCKTLQTRLYKAILASMNRQEQKADHLSVRAGDKVQMIYFQETIWLNYTCSARSNTGNVATVSITRDTGSYRPASKYCMASPLTSSVHAAFSRVIVPSGSLRSPRKLNLAHVSLLFLPLLLPRSACEPQGYQWPETKAGGWKNTTVIGAKAARCQSSRPRIKCQEKRGGARGTAGACLKWASAWLLCIHTHWFAHYNADPSRSPRAGTETQAKSS